MERYTNSDCKTDMEELMNDCPRNRSWAECWLRLCAIEDILGDEYSLEKLRDLVEIDRESEFQRHLKRFDIMPPKRHRE